MAWDTGTHRLVTKARLLLFGFPARVVHENAGDGENNCHTSLPQALSRF